MSEALLKEVQQGNFPVVGFVGKVYDDHPSAYTVLINREDNQLMASIGTKKVAVNNLKLLDEQVLTGEELVERRKRASKYKERRVEINQNPNREKVWQYSNIVGDVNFRFVD